MTDQRNSKSDPLAEAEIYLAYGRRLQAEKILEAAIQIDPSRGELQIKLAELKSMRERPEHSKEFRAFSRIQRATYILFIAGGMLIVFGFTRNEHASNWIAPGGLGWIIAYFLVVIENYAKKAPVQTRGGILHYEDSPARYTLPYLFMGFFGLLALIIDLVQLLSDYGPL